MQTFEAVRRHQLVTEFNVQSQSELVDYQVKLENVDNPTQAQDNLVVGTSGESLPHWNESLDFDTWVKMNIDISGKHGLLIHGNSGLNSESSITDAFIDGSEFNDLIGWTQQAGSWSISNGRLHSSASGEAYLRRDTPISESSYIVTTKAMTTNNVRFITMVEANNPMDVTSALSGQLTISTNVFDLRVDWSYSPTAETLNDDTFYISEIDVVSGSNIMRIYDAEHNYLDTTPTRSDSSGTGNYLGFFASGDDNEHDWFHIRKYTATEPTVHIGTPKNISTALKLFGMAG